MSLKGKKILVGITGGIAAYKIPSLIRLLIKSGAEIQVVTTPNALHFVTPLVLSTLSNKPVFSKFSHDETGQWNSHVALATWADLMLFAPLTANTLAKMAHGQADNLLTAVYLSAKCPVFVAPAMDLDMYAHPTTTRNIQTLQSFGNHIIPATNGFLASGLEGFGRMEEPENILKFLKDFFLKKKTLINKRVLITAGPTFEAIDPVRFIGNHSSGKMGLALAQTAAKMGAEVQLILGPNHLNIIHPNIKVTNVTSASEMYDAVHQHFAKTQITIMAAAVADFSPKNISKNKIKKGDHSFSLELEATKDILASLGNIKKDDQILVGFAMETQNELENAQKKLHKKKLDFIVLNSLNDKNAGFKHNTNKISILDKDGSIIHYGLKSKNEVAEDIFAHIMQLKK